MRNLTKQKTVSSCKTLAPSVDRQQKFSYIRIMNECIDIYLKLIIATITFVGPIIIVLLSTFNAGENRRKALAVQTEHEISKRLAEAVATNPETIREAVDKTSEEYKEIDKKTKSELNKLNPIRQFWCIYGSLATALFLLGLSFIIRTNTWNTYNHSLSVVVLTSSFLVYILALFFIIQVFYTIIRTKKIIEN